MVPCHQKRGRPQLQHCFPGKVSLPLRRDDTETQQNRVLPEATRWEEARPGLRLSALASRLPRSFLFLCCTALPRVSSGLSAAEAPGSLPAAAAILGRRRMPCRTCSPCASSQSARNVETNTELRLGNFRRIRKLLCFALGAKSPSHETAISWSWRLEREHSFARYIRVAGKVSDAMHIPAKEKLLWLVNNVGSLWQVPDRKGDLISPRAFVLFKKEKFRPQVLRPQRPDTPAVLTSGNVSSAANDQFRSLPRRSKAKLTVTRIPSSTSQNGGEQEAPDYVTPSIARTDMAS